MVKTGMSELTTINNDNERTVLWKKITTTTELHVAMIVCNKDIIPIFIPIDSLELSMASLMNTEKQLPNPTIIIIIQRIIGTTWSYRARLDSKKDNPPNMVIKLP